MTPYHDKVKRVYDVKLRMLRARRETADEILNWPKRIVPDTDRKAIIDKTQDNVLEEERVEKQHEEVKGQGIEL